jgi:hypothetical protein
VRDCLTQYCVLFTTQEGSDWEALSFSMQTMAHHVLLVLHKLVVARSYSKSAKTLTMEILLLILELIVSALCVFLAAIGLIMWHPVSAALEYFKNSEKSDFDLTKLEPYPLRPIEGKGAYRMNMGLRRLDFQNWLTIDKNYLQEHHVRSELLASEKGRVMRCLAGSEAACAEVLEVVVEHLTKHYPSAFQISRRNGKPTICITATGETFQVASPYGGLSPLEIAARLTMEDLSVLINHRKGAEYFLYASLTSYLFARSPSSRAASATMFPVGWNIGQRIGWPLSKLHSPVPTWKASIGGTVNQ